MKALSRFGKTIKPSPVTPATLCFCLGAGDIISKWPTETPAKYTVVCTPGGFDRFFRECAEEFKKPRPDFATLVKIGIKYGIESEGPPAS